MAHCKTEYTGIYVREGAGRKRLNPDGTRDKCYAVRYWRDGKWHFVTIGWESEGVTLAKALNKREELANSSTQPPPAEATVRKNTRKDPDQGEYTGRRIKTKFTGVYYRIAKKRILHDGKPDKCFDILYTLHGKNTYEKIGWVSEGYTVENAVTVRGERVKALRHPLLCPEAAALLTGPTLDAVWAVYKDRWLPNLKRAGDVEGIYRRYLQPAFGNRVINSILTLEIEDFKHQLLQKKDNEKPLAPGTVKIILVSLRRIINKAQSWELITPHKNPVSGIQVRGADNARQRYLTYAEAQRLLEDLQMISCTLYYMSKISIYTGMRLREILTLRKQDIDFFGGTIYVNNAKKGSRHAYLTDMILDDVKSLTCNATDYLFANPKTGKVFSATKLSAQFSEIADAMGLNRGITGSADKVVFHTLRHTFCSWLAIRGVALYTISKLVGHKDVTMTQRYVKLSPDSKREALNLLVPPLINKI